MAKYICHFKWGIHEGRRDTVVPNISTVKKGFWVNKYIEYTNGGDNEYWIPPSAVMFVSKV